MGMATFYLKAEFRNEKDAKLGEKIGEEVLNELDKFGNMWESIRSNFDIPVKDRPKELLNNFPLIEELFNIPLSDDDLGLDPLAGWNEINKENNFDFFRRENILYLSNEVWHFAMWEGICDLFKQLGAIKTGYLSDEYLDPFECIEMGKTDITPLDKEKLKQILFEVLL